jgi:hypothetical protein
MSVPRLIKVFIASPGDLVPERKALKNVVDKLNSGFGRGANVRFELLGWEDVLSQVGQRSQNIINRDVDACDIFVLVMWRRWGQKAPDAAPFTSYTQEEFYRALSRYEANGKPTIFMFFKRIDSGQIADPGRQLKKVLAFRNKLEKTRQIIYRSFDDEAGFEKEIDTHLVKFAQDKYNIFVANQDMPICTHTITAEINIPCTAGQDSKKASPSKHTLSTASNALLGSV